MAVSLEVLDNLDAPAVGITVEGLSTHEASRIAIYRQTPGKERTLVQGLGDVNVDGAGYWVDYLPPLGVPVTYTVEVLAGAWDGVFYEWTGVRDRSESVRLDPTGGDVTNTFTNPQFVGAGEEVVIQENVIPYPRPSVSTSMFSTTDATGVATGDDYREVEITSEVSGGTMFYRTGPANGFEDITNGETYTARVGVSNPNPYPLTLRAGLLRRTTASIGLSPTYSNDVTIPPGGYEEIETSTAVIDSNWNTVRVGLLAPSTGVIPAGARVRIHDGITANLGDRCARLCHPYMEDEGDGIYGVSYGTPGISPSCLVGRAVDGVASTGQVAAIQATSPTTGLQVVERGEYFGFGELGTFAQTVLPFEEGLDYTVTTNIGSTLPKVTIMSFHGGDIDGGTSEPAHQIATLLDANWYDMDGHVRPELGVGTSHDNLHITSNRFDDPRLTQLTWASDYGISVHGALDSAPDRNSPGSGSGVPYTFIGGLHDDLKEAIAAALRDAGFLCDTDVENFPGIKGIGDRNPIQLTRSRAGVQLEMSHTLRNQFYAGGDRSRPNRVNTTEVFDDYVAAVASGVRRYLGGV